MLLIIANVMILFEITFFCMIAFYFRWKAIKQITSFVFVLVSCCKSFLNLSFLRMYNVYGDSLFCGISSSRRDFRFKILSWCEFFSSWILDFRLLILYICRSKFYDPLLWVIQLIIVGYTTHNSELYDPLLWAVEFMLENFDYQPLKWIWLMKAKYDFRLAPNP